MRPLNSALAKAQSHLRRSNGDAVSTTPRLSPFDQGQILTAFWKVADHNRVLDRALWRLFWIGVVETGVLVGIGAAWAVNHWRLSDREIER